MHVRWNLLAAAAVIALATAAVAAAAVTPPPSIAQAGTGTASSAGTRPVTTTTTTVQSATCSAPVQEGNVAVSHCTGGVETWSGDITGTGTYSYDKIVNQTTGVRVTVNGVETIDNACVLGTCGGSLYARWNENDLMSGDFKIEESFQGGTGAFTQAHGSIRLTDTVNFVYSGQVGI
jgi:hypothetical protein